jgi:phage-related protein
VKQFLAELGKTQPRATAKIHEFVGEHLNGRRAAEPPPEYPLSPQVDGELRELRVRFARTRYRLLYRQSELLIVLLHAFEKSTGAIPAHDIELAIWRFDDFKARMDARPRRPPRAAGHDAPTPGTYQS